MAGSALLPRSLAPLARCWHRRGTPRPQGSGEGRGMTRDQPIAWMVKALIVGLAIALWWLGWTHAALAHDAMPSAAKPQGWKYPYSCCSSTDCREVKMGPKGTVRAEGSGYVIIK